MKPLRLRKKSICCVALLPSSLRRTISTPQSSGIGRLASGAFYFAVRKSVVFIVYELAERCGFVKSSYAALPFVPPHCDVPDVRLIRRDSGALPLELFTLPFEKSIV
ncbi:MAG TPA: hypothetical protein PLE04_12135 [Syntrophales bacterium]|nr:hypothetical protein [Syntrophales bacterium]HQN78821.1 hypothetical protein [Syntrophales bacterium]